MSRPCKVLNVAEKPSVAKEISRILSNNSSRSTQSCARFNGLHHFQYNANGLHYEMVFTSVLGHLMQLEFDTQFTKWRSCSPADLYHAGVSKQVPADKHDVQRNLETQARHCQKLVLWLDCDREGENIAFEVIAVCKRVNPRLDVWRARFSALIPRDLHTAITNLIPPNQHDANAVDARQEIDLRIGASFTRFQTMLLQDRFDWSSLEIGDPEKPLISYGPCQFPTLGLVVQRAWEIEAHVSEPFWYIHVSYKAPKEPRACDFTWDRGCLFDYPSATMLYEICVEHPMATVLKVEGRERKRWPPFPLSTLEMQKKATMYLRVPGERIMKLAEELYQAGFISYPRTETDIFAPGFDLQAMAAEHSQDQRWGRHAQAIVDGSMWLRPRGGGHDDKAHPPIHPTRYSSGENDWPPDKKRLYEFIVRSFLAGCSKPAIGFETTVRIAVADEGFHAQGLMVRERNWLDVYPYTNWGGNDSLPPLQEGQQFMPADLLLKQGATQPPPRLSERDLIALMESYGIGTDATVADHIQKQLDRGYVHKDANLTFWPSDLGQALVGAYRRMDLENLWLPDLRGKIEQNITAVARGMRTKEAVLQEAVQAFHADFLAAQQKQGVLEAEVAQFFQYAQGRAGGGNGPGGPQGPITGDALGPCPQCGAPILLQQADPPSRPAPGWTCSGICRSSTWLPARATSEAAVSMEDCSQCTHGQMQKVSLRFRRGLIPPEFPPALTACVVCDSTLQALLQACGPSARPQAAQNGPSNGPAPPRRGPAPGAARGARGGPARGGGRQPPPGQGWQSRHGSHHGEPMHDDNEEEAGGSPHAGYRPHGGSRATRAPSRGGRGQGSAAVAPRGRGSGRGASTQGRGASQGSGALPRCPHHGLEVLHLTSTTSANPGRYFYKCAHPSEFDACLRFAWADEWDGGGGTAGGSMQRGRGGVQIPGRGPAAGNQSRGQENWGARGNSFASATGHATGNGGTCFKCGLPGHYARDCPNG
ncbi:hypothetical protein WJX74_006318 [Apatococcus lobatus]|uniref:DNA topoisomerase n=1 Tax=Apatococcus lobatus TaxID=904363 RepID=A0AAW1RJR3_9CHLO